MLTKLTIIIAINHFVIIVNFCTCFDKTLTEIFQFCMALFLLLLFHNFSKQIFTNFINKLRNVEKWTLDNITTQISLSSSQMWKIRNNFLNQQKKIAKNLSLAFQTRAKQIVEEKLCLGSFLFSYYIFLTFCAKILRQYRNLWNQKETGVWA